MDLKWILLAVLVLAALVDHQVDAEIESRQDIWTSRSKDYKSKLEKLRAWDELFKNYYLDEIKSEERETETDVQLQKKWKTVLDCFRDKNRKNYLRNTENHNKYIICDVVTLLAPIFDSKIDLDNEKLSNKVSEEEPQSNKLEIEEKAAKFIRNKINREESLFKELSNMVHNVKNQRSLIPKPDEKIDHAKHFLMSLLEDFEAIPKTYKVDAKYEILAVLRKYNKYNDTISTPMPALLTPENKHPESIDTDSSVLTDLFSE